MSELLSHVSARQGMTRGARNQRGERTLDEFFASLEPLVEHDLPLVSPCMPTFRATIDSLLQFLDEVYPHIVGTERLEAVYKAYAGVVGDVCGAYFFWQSQNGKCTSPLEKLASLLKNGLRG